MARFFLVLFVAVLAISASGVSSLIVTEPCNAGHVAGEDDGTCPPTCVTCGCCAQAAEPAAVSAARTPDLPVPCITAVLPGLSLTDPREILHVPRARLV